jgi:signal transduction histidine kinase
MPMTGTARLARTDTRITEHGIDLAEGRSDVLSLPRLMMDFERLEALQLAQVGAPLIVCDGAGRVVGLTPDAEKLLGWLGIPTEPLPSPLPESLWLRVRHAEVAESVEWRPACGRECIAFTRHALGREHSLVLLQEISTKPNELSRRLHRRRLEATGRLVTAMAKDLRAPMASIMLDVDTMIRDASCLSVLDRADILRDVQDAVRRLRWAVDGVLACTHLGPEVSADVQLSQVIDSASRLLSPACREWGHRLSAQIGPGTEWVWTNPLILEQVLLNLLLNSMEAAGGAAHISIQSSVICGPVISAAGVEVRVSDDGPGIEPSIAGRVFEPFFTTKARAAGLGLTTAREAMLALGGDLILAEAAQGAAFVVTLKAGRPGPVKEHRVGSDCG